MVSRVAGGGVSACWTLMVGPGVSGGWTRMLEYPVSKLNKITIKIGLD